MKHLFLFLLLVANTANANEGLGRLLADYSTIAGSWHLNQKCKLVSGDAAIEFYWNVEKLTETLGGHPLTKSIQKSAKEATRIEPYSSCGKEAQTVITTGVSAAKFAVQKIAGESFDKASFAQRSVKLLKASTAFMKFGENCPFSSKISAKVMSSTFKAIDELHQTIQNLYPDEYQAYNFDDSDLPDTCNKSSQAMFAVAGQEIIRLNNIFLSGS